jgi:hypothetical protein
MLIKDTIKIIKHSWMIDKKLLIEDNRLAIIEIA